MAGKRSRARDMRPAIFHERPDRFPMRNHSRVRERPLDPLMMINLTRSRECRVADYVFVDVNITCTRVTSYSAFVNAM